MLERRQVTLDNRQGTTRKVFTSREDIVYVELQARCPERFAVRITPMPKFDQGSDYLVEVTIAGGTTSTRTLYGTTPDWASQPETIDIDGLESAEGAVLVAYPEMTSV